MPVTASCNAKTKTDIHWYLDHRIVLSNYQLVVSDVTVLERPSPDEVKLRFISELKPYQLLNERLEKLGDRPGVAAMSHIAHLKRENVRWMVASIGPEKER